MVYFPKSGGVNSIYADFTTIASLCWVNVF